MPGTQKGNLLRQYLELSHPHINFTYVDIDNFEGPGSGLGYTLSKTHKIIDKPFISTQMMQSLLKIPNFDEDTIILFIKYD